MAGAGFKRISIVHALKPHSAASNIIRPGTEKILRVVSWKLNDLKQQRKIEQYAKIINASKITE